MDNGNGFCLAKNLFSIILIFNDSIIGEGKNIWKSCGPILVPFAFNRAVKPEICKKNDSVIKTVSKCNQII